MRIPEKSLPVSASSLPPHDRSSAHTRGHRNCPACDAARKAMIEPKALAVLPFPDAAKVWLDSHRRHIAANSTRDYEQCITSLTKFFGDLRLEEIHIGHFEQYQRMRLEAAESFATSKTAGPSRINHELNTLSQILTRAALWAPIAPYYKPLRLPRPKAGRVLTEDQEKHLFAIARTKSKWRVAYYCSLLTVNTTCGPKEIRMLRLRDINLMPTPATPFGTITIKEGAKNQYRDRPIPLNQTARLALNELLKRARENGAVDPDHYLLPHRAANGAKGWDPTRPMYAWRTAWDKLREAAGLPGLRMYDLRHHVITKLLEDETVPERTVIELAGHVSRKMLDTYSHIRMRSKLQGVLALDKSNLIPLAAPEPQDPGRKPPERVAGAGLATEKLQ